MNAFQIETLQQAQAGSLPDQLGGDYTLGQLAQCKELLDAGLLSGEPIENEDGYVCCIIHPSITLRGREALEHIDTGRAEELSKTRVEKTIKRLHNKPWVARLVVIALCLGGIAYVVTSLDKIISFCQKYVLHSTVVNTDPNPIRYISHVIEKAGQGFNVLIHLRREKEDAPWGRHSFQATLPEQSPCRILEFKGATGGQYFESSITNNGKRAEATYSPFLEAALNLKLSGPTAVTISGNHGLETFQLEIK